MNKNFLDIIVIDNDLEALAARASAEWWQVVTRTFFIGKSQDLVDILNGKQKLSPHILLMCHGVDEGIVLPELGEEIAKQQPYDKFLTGVNLSEFLKLDGQIVVSTGCKTGIKDFADAFLNAGAKNYIAPKDYPMGNASLFYVLNFYYHLFAKKLSVDDAHNKAKKIDSDTEMFELFK
ncbi:MAG: hypothetical protein WDZ40_02190 [Candidatus Spechtbacterales bacterium]